jgi:radical SAM superfamily enzyme YgiQ (UPF0313 family)
MSRVPPPRLDLLRRGAYAHGSVQFSRGCPFTCEFCDIIVVFGRRPRLKTAGQIAAELDGLLAQGLHTAFVVDDNLVGNKRAVKELLREVVRWQQDRILRTRPDPALLQLYTVKCAMHYHAHTMVRQMLDGGPVINSF